MTDLDSALRRLAEAPAPEKLASIEADVMARVAEHSFGKESLRVRAAAVGFAFLIGIAGGMLPDASARAKDTGPALSKAVELAPSTLLAGSL